MIVPSGEKIILLGQLPPAPNTSSYRIYREKNDEPPKAVAGLPLWSRNPNLFLDAMGEEDFLEFAKKFDAETPAELMHKAGSQQVIILATSAIVPKYPTLIQLFENSYIYIDEDIEKGASYSYEVKRLDSAGNELDFGAWEQIFYGEFNGRRRKRVLVKIIGG